MRTGDGFLGFYRQHNLLRNLLSFAIRCVYEILKRYCDPQIGEKPCFTVRRSTLWAGLLGRGRPCRSCPSAQKFWMTSLLWVVRHVKFPYPYNYLYSLKKYLFQYFGSMSNEILYLADVALKLNLKTDLLDNFIWV